MKARLQHFMEQEGLSPAKLADILEIQRSGLSHILSGRNKPGFDFIYKLIKSYPLLNAEWLITGKGNMYKEQRGLFDSNSPEIDTGKTHGKPLFDSVNEEVIQNSTNVESIENPNFRQISNNCPENKILVKALLFYSDGTFEDYVANKD
ncbi:MAG: helix-turn-helix transcriptional regulator [Bacteroidales bacterium]|nr:helix-turn-helix transcriptional regulator [Bacteroidales bacterium]MDD3843684.1 helix-turn-helix transcriptional regulator [Bacteroidales bacterium]